MISPTIRLCSTKVNKCKPIIEEIIRNISKTASATNQTNINKNKIKNASDSDKKLFKFKKHQRILVDRALSTAPLTKPTIFESDQDKLRDFMSVFPLIVHDLTQDDKYDDVPDVNVWFTRLLHYNVPHGKRNRAVELAVAYKMLESKTNLSEEKMKLAYILGWCCEMLKATFVITEDIINSAETRRGMLSWYKVDGVGLSAINDSIMLENAVYMILKKYFRVHPFYVPMMELFHDMTMKTTMGLCLDTHCRKNGRPNLDAFTMDRYKAIAKYKTGYYTFKLPVGLAMYLAGIHETEYHRQAKHILLEIGQMLQVQNDFLDCYGNPEVTGKESTDIREGKCTWLAVVALQRATSEQRKLFEQYYGNPDPESIQVIKDLYEELGIPNTYSLYTEKTYNLIRTHIQQMSGRLPHKLFITILEMVYGKEKQEW